MGKSAEVRLAFFRSKASRSATVIRVEERWQDMLHVVADEFELDHKTVKLFGTETSAEPDQPGTSENQFRFTRSSWPAVLDMPRFRLFGPKDTGHILVEGSPNAEHVCQARPTEKSRIESKDPDTDSSSKPDSSPAVRKRSSPRPSAPPPKPLPAGCIEVIIQLTDGTKIPFFVERTTRLNKVKVALADRCGEDPNQIRLLFDGQGIGRGQTAEDLLDGPDLPGEIIYDDNGDLRAIMLFALFNQAGGKPVIYLWPPTELDVSVGLALSPEWSFSAIYPPTPIVGSESGGEVANRVDWVVRAWPDGNLKQSATGLNVSYLFWEVCYVLKRLSISGSYHSTNKTRNNEKIAGAIEDAGIIKTAGIDKTGTGQAPKSRTAFRPAHTRLHPQDEHVVVVAGDQIPLYLDQALRTLGLHTEARTSFITYWLPYLLRHKYVALTFVPQTDYEQAAPLYIDPKPDVITGVFMLFQGIQLDQLSLWSEAQTRADSDVGVWRDVIGVASYEKQDDTKLFRVLEWGGMEIK